MLHYHDAALGKSLFFFFFSNGLFCVAEMSLRNQERKIRNLGTR